MNPEQKVFFLHVPKCGGTSLDRAIANLFPKNARARLGSAPSYEAASLLGEPLGAYREHLLLYMLSQPMKRFVAGHFSWSDIAYRRFHPEWTFITVLREPVSRWLSNYFYRRYKKSDYNRTDMGLVEFLESAEGESAGRKYVSQLASPELARAAPSDLSAMQASARENLARFDLVGFVEHFDLLARDFEALTGSELEIGLERPSPRVQEERERELTPEIVERVREVCRLDIELYDYAVGKILGARSGSGDSGGRPERAPWFRAAATWIGGRGRTPGTPTR